MFLQRIKCFCSGGAANAQDFPHLRKQGMVLAKLAWIGEKEDGKTGEDGALWSSRYIPLTSGKSSGHSTTVVEEFCSFLLISAKFFTDKHNYVVVYMPLSFGRKRLPRKKTSMR